MRKGLLAFLLLAALVASFAPRADAWVGAQKDAKESKKAEKDGRDHDDYAERDEFSRSFTLQPGAEVRVSSINGSVDVETHSGNTAEVHVVRSARTRGDLDYHKVIVEQTASGLVVRGERTDDRDGRRDDHNVRQRVTLRLPRSVDFTANSVNGRTSVGEIDGPVRLSSINGRVEIGQARGYTELSSINGSVVANVSQLGERGIRISSVNGRVELRLGGAVNADLSVSSVNGAIETQLQNVVVQGEVNRSTFNARIGAGGSPISVRSVNGAVRLTPRS
jgi:hypothetical protein